MNKENLPLSKFQHDLWQNYTTKICLHPNAEEDCEGSICRAHTISKSSTLEKIINKDNKVFSFFPVGPEGPKIHEKGWQKESTVFLGFCQKHDDQVFADIEKKEFQVTPKQCFLLGYRALCHEYYMKKASVDSADLLEDYCEKYGDGVDEYFLEHQNKEFEEGYNHVKIIKNIYDKALLADQYEDFNYVSISFSGPLSVVSTGMMTPDFSLDGQKLQDYFNFFGENLFFGFISRGGRNYFIFHWPSKFDKVTEYIESVLNFNKVHLPDFLVQFIFNYVENTYFSESWWKNLKSEDKYFVTNLAYGQQPYGQPLRVKNLKVVNWKNIKIHKNYL